MTFSVVYLPILEENSTGRNQLHSESEWKEVKRRKTHKIPDKVGAYEIYLKCSRLLDRNLHVSQYTKNHLYYMNRYSSFASDYNV